jgi:hypothetical protein
MAGWFGKWSKRVPSSGGNPQFAHPASPQYNKGVEPAGSARQDGFTNYKQPNHPAIVTSGFDDCGMPSASINYGYRSQPDRGGALNYAYENYGLPLENVAGPWMVARSPSKPLGSTPMQQWATMVPTGAGLFPGQVISQPLLNPQGPDSGFDIYN